MRAGLKAVSIAAAMALASLAAHAEDITVVKHVTPEWQGFTDADGSGLYNELLREAFAVSGVKVERSYVPLNRAEALVERGDADFTGGFSKDDRNFAAVPIFETTIGLMGRNDVLAGYEGLDDLAGLRVVGPPAAAQEIGLIDSAVEVDSRVQAAKLITSGRADVYIDLMMILEDFLATGEATLDVSDAIEAEDQFDLTSEDWTLAVARRTQLFLLFPDTDRGNEVRDLFDNGVRALAASGRLEAIYSAYSFETPSVE